MKYKLLSVDADAKTSKGFALGWLTGILYFQPSDLIGVAGVNLCTNAGACRAACLVSAGRGAFDSVWNGRAGKLYCT